LEALDLFLVGYCGEILKLMYLNLTLLNKLIVINMSKRNRVTLPSARGITAVFEDPFTWIDATSAALLTGALLLYIAPLGLTTRENVMVMATVFGASVGSKAILGTSFGLNIAEKLDSAVGIGFLE